MRIAIFSLILCAASAFAQSPAPEKSLAFEVASVKPAAPITPDAQGRMFFRGPSGGPGTKDPGRINYPNMTLKNLVMVAYDVKNYQITGPSWMDSERFDITATMPPDTTKEQFHTMLQNLLAERFKVSLHKEKKELPMYSLVVVKPGKLKESAPSTAVDTADGPPMPPPLPPGPPKIGPDGFPVMPAPNLGRPAMMMMMMPGRARVTATQQSMQDLANRLTNQLNRPVIDNTGLTAKYDFVLTYAPDPNDGPGRGGPGMGGAMVAVSRTVGPGPGPAPGPGGNDNVFLPEGEAPQPLFGALQSQLGLKLEPKKGDVDFIVIDKAEKSPIEN